MAGTHNYVTKQSFKVPFTTLPLTPPASPILKSLSTPLSQEAAKVTSPTMESQYPVSTPTSLYILFTLSSSTTQTTSSMDAEATPIAVTSRSSSPFPSPSSSIASYSPTSSVSSSPSLASDYEFFHDEDKGFPIEDKDFHIDDDVDDDDDGDDEDDGDDDDDIDEFCDDDFEFYKNQFCSLPIDTLQRRDSYFTFCESESTLEFHFPIPPRSPVSPKVLLAKPALPPPPPSQQQQQPETTQQRHNGDGNAEAEDAEAGGRGVEDCQDDDAPGAVEDKHDRYVSRNDDSVRIRDSADDSIGNASRSDSIVRHVLQA